MELVVTETGRSSHRRTHLVTILSKCSQIQVLGMSATVKCQDGYWTKQKSALIF